MKIMVIGSGGREHALSERLSKDSGVDGVWVYPGNPGMRITPKLQICGGQVSLNQILSLVRENKIDLVVIGPEKYLFEGYVDQLKKAGVAIFGPTQAAAFLEESKIESKLFMKEFGIPTSDFAIAQSEVDANGIIGARPHWKGYALKLSGPALGKGVVVTTTPTDAREAAHQLYLYRPPGIESGMVIEEKISGREVSLFYVCDGSDSKFVASACDHKRLLDRDEGPNTGGMGAYSPCHWIDDSFLKEIKEKIVVPTLQGMISRGTPFSGMLFLGLMVNAGGFSLLEYNTRFGDPETQTFLPILKGNLAKVLYAAATGKLKEETETLSCAGEHSLHIVKAANGYPGVFGETIESGKEISGDASTLINAQIFYAGVKEEANQLVSSGGRVLGITGIGMTAGAARVSAYENISKVNFSGEQYRSDIGGAS
jgi:phosphoribosylamine--glycine ligase